VQRAAAQSLVRSARPCGEFVFGPVANDTRLARIQNWSHAAESFVARAVLAAASGPGCAFSDWRVPLTVSGIGAVRSRSNGLGPLDATFAAAFWSG
jgi:hypothetical protein